MNEYKHHKKVNRKPNNTGSAVVAVFMAVFVVFAAIIGLVIFSKPDISQSRDESHNVEYYTDALGNKYYTSVNEDGENIKVEIDKLVKDNHYNFIVVGKDRAYYNTDVIMLVSFDADIGALSMMQIPRDTYIELENDARRVRKANSLLANLKRGTDKKGLNEGLEKLKTAFSEVLGVPIDYYVMLDLNGFVNIVDAIGGVDMYVPTDMHYDDPEQNLYINLKKGYQNLDGDESEQFIRFRKGYVNADLGRVDAQKLFMRAFIEKVQKKFNINTIVTIAEQLSKYVTTDLQISDMVFFAKKALSVDTEKVIMSTIPGDLAGAYYVASRSGTYEAINTYFNPYNTPIKESAFDPYGRLYDEEGTKIYAVYTGDDSLLAYHNSQEIKIPQVVTTGETTDEVIETTLSVETTAPVESVTVHTGTEEPAEMTAETTNEPTEETTNESDASDTEEITAQTEIVTTEIPEVTETAQMTEEIEVPTEAVEE